jgi:hypothetical protein
MQKPLQKGAKEPIQALEKGVRQSMKPLEKVISKGQALEKGFAKKNMEKEGNMEQRKGNQFHLLKRERENYCLPSKQGEELQPRAHKQKEL